MKSAKLRTTWAKVSTDLDPYRLYNTYTSTGMYNPIGNGISVSLLSAGINPPSQLHGKLEATSLFNNRVDLDVTYFHTIDKNQIIDLPTSITSGYSSQKVNGNVYKTTGWKLW
jgi:hypothetical protein